MTYRREVDGLRAVAVLPVLLFHAGLGPFGGGFVGVDVFFVISGYLITSLLVAELETGRIDLRLFWERRVRRIVPALATVVLATLPFAWLWLAPDDMRRFCNSVIGVAFFASNVIFWRESGYFDTAGELKPLLHTWSLAVEGQFYVLFPLLLAWLWRFGRQAVAVVVAALLVGGLLLAQVWLGRDATAAYFLLPARGWELLVGALVAVVLATRGSPDGVLAKGSPGLAQVASALGLAGILLAVFGFDAATPFPGVAALLPTVGAALVLLWASPRTLVGAALGNRFMVGIGMLSYSLYLWHRPLLAFARVRCIGVPSMALRAGLLLLSVVLAYVTWRFVERPFRQRRTVPTRPLWLLASTLTVGFVAFGVGGRATDGYESVRLDAHQVALRSTALPSPLRARCHTLDIADFRPPAEACAYFGHQVRWAVLGDSHGVELAYALAEALRPSDVGLRQLTFSGCGPTTGREALRSNCHRWADQALAGLLADRAIDTVVLSYRLGLYLFGEHGQVYPAQPAAVSEAERAAVWRAFVAQTAALRAAGKRVVVVLQAPELRKAVGDLVLIGAGDNIAGMGRAWWDARQRFVYAHLAELPVGTIVVDPADGLCDAEACLAVKDGRATYFDDNHLSVHGARPVARRILELAPLAP